MWWTAAKKAIEDQFLTILEKRCSECLVTEKGGMKALMFHVEAMPDQKAASEPSKAVYNGNQGKRGKTFC